MPCVDARSVSNQMSWSSSDRTENSAPVEEHAGYTGYCSHHMSRGHEFQCRHDSKPRDAPSLSGARGGHTVATHCSRSRSHSSYSDPSPAGPDGPIASEFPPWSQSVSHAVSKRIWMNMINLPTARSTLGFSMAKVANGKGNVCILSNQSREEWRFTQSNQLGLGEAAADTGPTHTVGS